MQRNQEMIQPIFLPAPWPKAFASLLSKNPKALGLACGMRGWMAQ